MKILITGKNSYIGKSVKAYLEKQGNHSVFELDLLDPGWENHSFSEYDTVIHVAAIVHCRENRISYEEYYQVNTYLASEVARCAKNQGVAQFVFLSTMGIYGQGKKLPYGNVITRQSVPLPCSAYGKTKYEAEKRILELGDDCFKIVIIRPPNIYGKDCPGNYFKGFIRLSEFLPVFPHCFTESRQSVLYIQNLTEVIKQLIEKKKSGIFHPQDKNPLSTIELVKMIATSKNKKIYFSKCLGFFVKIFSKLPLICKVYGGVSYSDDLSAIKGIEYQLFSTSEAIQNSI